MNEPRCPQGLKLNLIRLPAAPADEGPNIVEIPLFDCSLLGDIKAGRPNLGDETKVAVCRFTIEPLL